MTTRTARERTRGSTRSATANVWKSAGFTDEERAAMKDRIQELKAAKEGGESSVVAKIGEMAEPDRAIGKPLHAIIKASAPSLSPRLWYGMPGTPTRTARVVCFFQLAQKFKTRYATLRFSDRASLDEGAMWPTTYAVKALNAAEEARISALVKRAVS